MPWAKELGLMGTKVLEITEVFVAVFTVVLNATSKWKWAEWGGACFCSCDGDTMILGMPVGFKQNM